MDWQQYSILFLVAAVAGAVNSVAGGGTLLTFPALVWIGQLPEILANATSTVALWPGQLGSLWGYRQQMGQSRKAMGLLAVPSLLGGLLGACLLLRTDNATFRALVPYLILLATVLFMLQGPLARWQRRHTDQTPGQGLVPDLPAAPGRWVAVMVFQLLVGIYGGYFGAGIGILMLAALGFLGLTNIHQMNGLKNINNMCINAVAAVLFMLGGLVDWPLAGCMALGAIAGGYAGAGIAQRIGQANVRRLVIAIGLALSAAMFLRT